MEENSQYVDLSDMGEGGESERERWRGSRTRRGRHDL